MARIEGSGKDYFGAMNADQYRAKINTPAKNPVYFQKFHLPIINRAKKRVGEGNQIRVLDIACGPADELDFFKNDQGVQIVATDISHKILPSVREKLGTRSIVFASDVNNSALKDNSVDAGILVNAVVYEPDKMLETMYRALKPRGECAVNFRAFDNEHNLAFYQYYLKRGGKILDRELTVDTKKGRKTFKVKVLDYTECVDDTGAPDLQIRRLVQQVYFQNVYEIGELIRLIGFQKVNHSTFNFASPVNKNNQIDVFILRKL